MRTLGEDNMFQGKNLPLFFCEYSELYKSLVEQHGIDKVRNVYKYFFRFCCRMQWGQWMTLSKVCPDFNMRQLFYWVMECIYQSDLCSQFRFVHIPTDDPSIDEVRIVLVPPPPRLIEKWSVFLGNRRYLFIDWYSRLLQDPKCNSDIDPSLLMLDTQPNQPDDPPYNDSPPEDQ